MTAGRPHQVSGRWIDPRRNALRLAWLQADLAGRAWHLDELELGSRVAGELWVEARLGAVQALEYRRPPNWPAYP